MTEYQKARLQAAVDELNAAMASVLEAGGRSVRVYPRTHFSDDDGLSRVSVEVTTGRVVIGDQR